MREFMERDQKIDKSYVGYIRVSTDDQELRMQRDALEQFGVDPNQIFSDKMTGSKMDRPGLNLAMKVCRSGSVLVVWKLDRLGRSVMGVMRTMEMLEERGIKVKSLTQPVDTSDPMGRAMVTLILVFAQMERDMISERTKAGIKAYMDRGGRMGRPHAFLSYPKRMAKFAELYNEDLLNKMTAKEIIAAMEKADTKAPPIKQTSSYYNWKSKGFAGFDPEDFDEGKE